MIISPTMSKPISARRNIGVRSGMNQEEDFQLTTPVGGARPLGTAVLKIGAKFRSEITKTTRTDGGRRRGHEQEVCSHLRV